MLSIFILRILAAAVIGYAVGGLITISIQHFINAKALKGIVRYQCPEALAILIKEKKKDAIKIGVFDETEDDITTEMEISSDKGVSSRLHEGQVIYI